MLIKQGLSKIYQGKVPIGCQWSFKLKYKADGTIEIHKARIVEKGHTQTKGTIYKLFHLWQKMTTIR